MVPVVYHWLLVSMTVTNTVADITERPGTVTASTSMLQVFPSVQARCSSGGRYHPRQGCGEPHSASVVELIFRRSLCRLRREVPGPAPAVRVTQVLHKHHEYIAMTYRAPLRVPRPRKGGREHGRVKPDKSTHAVLD